jgi:hypothetical protein
MEERELVIGGETVTLADIAGIDILGDKNVKEVRHVTTPAGLYCFEVGKDGGKLVAKNNGVSSIILPNTIIQIINIKPGAKMPQDDPEGKALMGKVLNAEWPFFDVMETLGRFKAFCVDTRFTTNVSGLENILASMAGHRWIGKVVNKPNENDPENPYANIDVLYSKVLPFQEAAA